MTEPIDASVGQLLFHLVKRGDLYSSYRDISREPRMVDAARIADSLEPCPIEHLGGRSTTDWYFVRLTRFGETVVEEMIAAARAVTHTEDHHG